MVPGVVFSRQEWQALLCFRLGINISPADRCAQCAEQMPSNGDHALACAGCGFYHRHNRIRDFLAEECRDAGWEVEIEVPIPLPNNPPDPPNPLNPPPPSERPRPVDVFIPNRGAPKPVAVDITVSHALRLIFELAMKF